MTNTMSEDRLRNVRAWAAARSDMSGSEVIVGAIDELLHLRAEVERLQRAWDSSFAQALQNGEAANRLREALARIAAGFYTETGAEQHAKDILRLAVEPIAAPVERLEPDGRMYRWCQHGAGFGVKCPTCFGLPACPQCGRGDGGGAGPSGVK